MRKRKFVISPVLILSVYGFVHTIPDSFCAAKKTTRGRASVHSRERLSRCETAPRLPQKWSVTYRIGFVIYFGAMGTPIAHFGKE